MKTNTIDEAKLREILIPAFFPESGFDFKPNARTEKRIADMITAIQSLAAEAADDTWKEAYDQGYRDAKNGN